ncbi:unnamed protein product [Symbiodinium microadriaticum]|nr:unnamed protein product [Symbiodinium microadriaticum]
MERARVRRMYFLSWFPLDCIATIPYDLVANLSIGRAESLQFDGSIIYGDLHIVQLLKLVRLLRLFKTVKLMTVFEKALVFRYEDVALSKFILFVFFCLHWSACLFSWLDENHCDLTEHSSFQYAAGIQDANIGPRYFAALYWALATMTTIGYG